MERNPYILLGLPYGATRDEANVAFARRAKALRRRGEAGKDGLVELTWALNQIDEAIADPNTTIEVFRIPADPYAFESDRSGLFNPPPEPLERRQPASDEAIASLRSRAALEILVSTVLVVGRELEVPEY